MKTPLAIVGLACHYPGASSPGALWENVLAQRRSFRRLPPERLRLTDYYSPNRNAPDRTYSMEAALIDGYEFDRVKFKVVGSTFRSADLAHWLALDVAAQALSDAGFNDGHGLPHDSTGVVLGNTLTGEFSRASLMRYRWPYVRRTLEAELQPEGWPPQKRQAFLAALEARYKSPFAPVGEESLAGGLSNTIAGRICNHFDLKGGGFTVDGACASSLLAITTACASLLDGDLDVALAGGVDLSLDPFEIIGFAKAGALAAEEMRVYDARSDGFWPGEGCGFVVLMRHDEAIGQGRRIYATIRGWGVSSDGSGGLTRPEEEGQLLALRRAYRRAGFGIETVGYFEGHGTGTSVGDATELRTLSRARREGLSREKQRQNGKAPLAAISSIKANIGHTKAAAGIAGIIKAVMALHTQVLPPGTGCEEPHPELAGESPALRSLPEPQLWPRDLPLRAGVNSMGFGGINSHVVLEGVAADRRKTFTLRERALSRSAQDAELFLLSGRNKADLRAQVQRLLAYAARLARAELTDLAAELARRLEADEVRAAVVASRPAELAHRLESLLARLDEGGRENLDFSSGVFYGEGRQSTRLGFLFPGQGSPAHLDGGIYRRRFATVEDLYAGGLFPMEGDGIATDAAQPAIVTASVAGLRVLGEFGLCATIAVGHSLGELTAFHWAGALAEESLLRIAAARGKAMAELGSPTGAMAGIEAGQEQIRSLLNGELVVIAGLNSPRQTVISGPAGEVAAVVKRALGAGLRAMKLPVSHAFHSVLVGAATPALARQLARETFHPLQRPVASTVTGSLLNPQDDLRDLLCRQVTSPVRFIEAVSTAIQGELPEDSAINSPLSRLPQGPRFWIEVGPGRVLGGLFADIADAPVVSLDAGGPSLRGLLQAAGAAFAAGVPLRHSALFAGRFCRPFNLDWRPRFFVNPCELAAGPDSADTTLDARALEIPADASADPPAAQASQAVHPAPGSPPSPLDLVRQLVAERAELPAAAVRDQSRMLSDLHLNSITVGQLVAEAARRLGLPPLVSVIEFANATVAKIAQALEEILHTGDSGAIEEQNRPPAGVDSWIRPFTMEWVETSLTREPPGISGSSNHSTATGKWQVIAPAGHPLVSALEQLLAGAKGSGVIVCLPPEPPMPQHAPQPSGSSSEETVIKLLLEGAGAALAMKGDTRFILVQDACTAGGFARSLHLEAPEMAARVVNVPMAHPQAAEWIRDEALAAFGYLEARYDVSGVRREPRLKLLTLNEDALKPPPLGPQDVLLVTGGGKGIAAECALALARRNGARLVLLGRSVPALDPELAANLERFAAAGIECRYFAADVTDREAVRQAIAEAQEKVGAITALLHGAGTNVPRLVSALDEDAFRRTMGPKIQGLRNVLAAVKPEQLRLFITFGSIIARSGLPGEADYAVANEWLTALTERFQNENPRCRCLALEWSVWSGVGMGQRLGRVETLHQQGITPIPPDQGVELLLRLLAAPLPATSVIVSGRFGNTPTLRTDKADLPFARFLERPRVFYPGVELVVDAELSSDSDPYVDDHVYHGERLFPAVMGLEAMAQAAMALAGSSAPPSFENVRLNRPLVAPRNRRTVLRIAALLRKPGRVEVALRSEETGFQVDHFTAVCQFGSADSQREPADPSEAQSRSTTPDLKSSALPIEPVREIYGELLFHSGRFQRLRSYRHLRARECVAEINPDPGMPWFGRYLPADLVLGDPGARDAAIHAIQACIPHARLLPVGVDRITAAPPSSLPTPAGQNSSPLFLHAREQSREGETFTYELEISRADGSVLERWEGLRLRAVERLTRRTPWPEPLLGPYLERRLEDFVPGAAVAIAMERHAQEDRTAGSDRAIRRLLGPDQAVRRRPDGKVETDGAQAVSVSHAGELTLAIAGSAPLGCDLEFIVARPAEVWRDLLGPSRFRLAEVIASESKGIFDASATRIWMAVECLKKAGQAIDAPLVLGPVEEDDWVLLRSGSLTVATLVTEVRGAKERLGIGVLLSGTSES